MSYYRPSYSQTVAMSRGMGRGGYSSSRGGSSYRGSSGRGASSWDRPSTRGSFSSTRGSGRFSSSSSSSWNHSSSFDRSRYSTSATDRYSSSSRGRPEESSYRRSSYSRSDGPSSYSRENSTRSPDRKRIRTEAPSSRRSHDNGGSSSYADSYGTSRYGASVHENSTSSRTFSADRHRPAPLPPPPSATTFARPRDDYRSKPPSSSSITRASPRRGGGGGGTIYRGGRSRGTRGGSGRVPIRESIVRRRLVDSSYIRKRGTSLRSSDYVRRLRIARLRSAARRPLRKTKSIDKDDSDKDVENWDDDDDDNTKKKDASEKGDDEKPALAAKKISPKKERKSFDKDDINEKNSVDKKNADDDDDDDEDDDDKKSKSASDDEDRPRSKYTGRPFIRLTCIHCATKCVTFREYQHHLNMTRHILAMRKVAIKQKSVVARMRQAQRSNQRELEKNDDDLAPRTNFCPLCKLNYRQMKSVHQLSEAHRSMKKFLMPYCRVCHITFKSPMLYENHMCSLEHIKRKAQTEAVNGEKNNSEKDPGSPTEEDLENFMTLDSVGDVDEDDEDGNKISKSPTAVTPTTEGGAADDSESTSKPKESINVGAEHVKKVEVYYCDLCRIYLSRHEEAERTIKQHCRGRQHLRLYVRYKEDKELRRQAERIHRKSQEAKEAKEKEKEKEKIKTEIKTEDVSEEKEEKEKNAKTDAEGSKSEEEAVVDKMWEDVAKDLGEILAEVEPDNKSSDDDEDSRPDGERYDRFRSREKGAEAADEKKEIEAKETEAKDNKVEDDKKDEKDNEKSTESK